MDVKRWAVAGVVVVLVTLMVVGPFVQMAWAGDARAFLEGSARLRRQSSGLEASSATRGRDMGCSERGEGCGPLWD